MRKMLFWLLVAITLIIAGCGGGGGGGGSSSGGGVTLFATDDLHAGYDAVWVKIHKIQLRKADDTFVTIFDDSAGRSVNLRALNDGANRFLYMGDDSVPDGTYTGLRVELDRNVTLFPVSQSNGQQRVFDDVYGTPRANLDLIFGSNKTVAGAGINLVVDFDLAQWEDVAGEVRNAVITEGSTLGLNNVLRHEHEDYKGTIQGLSGTAPNFTFTLQTSANNKIQVETDSNTAIFNNNGQPNPTLANGRRVEVRGTFNPVSGALLATSIKLKGSGDDDDFEVEGTPSEASFALGTFKVLVQEAEGFIPTSTTVNITTNPTTVYFGRRGVLITAQEFYAAIGGTDTGSLKVEVEGTVYDSVTNTLIAKKCKLDDDDNENDEAEARGPASAINAEAGTFNITLREWEGFSATQGQTLAVAVQPSATFKNANGQSMTREAFFAALASAPAVKVKGLYIEGQIQAWRCELKSSTGGGGGGQAEAEGSVSNVNAGAKTFSVQLVEWIGFSGSAGQIINVQMSNSATYRNDDGDSITAEQFFGVLVGGGLVEVEGSWNGSVFTATKAKLDDD